MLYGARVRRPLTTAAIVAVVALVGAGCGGGGGGGTSSTSTGPLSKAEYITRGDTVCKLGTLAIGQAGRERFGTSNATRQQAVQFGQQVVVPSLEDTLRKLRALQPPAGDEAQTTAIYAALEKAINQLKQNPDLFVQSHQGGIFDEANRLAQAYGFKQCGQG
jgi:hypothetical protein